MKQETKKETKKQNGKEIQNENALKKELAQLKEKLTRLEEFMQMQSMNVERLISRVNRIDMYQTEMDVMIRNHKHHPSVPNGTGQEGVK